MNAADKIGTAESILGGQSRYTPKTDEAREQATVNVLRQASFEIEGLRREIDRLRPDAEAYRRIGQMLDLMHRGNERDRAGYGEDCVWRLNVEIERREDAMRQAKRDENRRNYNAGYNEDDDRGDTSDFGEERDDIRKTNEDVKMRDMTEDERAKLREALADMIPPPAQPTAAETVVEPKREPDDRETMRQMLARETLDTSAIQPADREIVRPRAAIEPEAPFPRAG